jgi:type I site-specific restriction endonuclease
MTKRAAEARRYEVREVADGDQMRWQVYSSDVRLEERPERSPEEAELLTSLRDDLHRQVQGMHHENFFVRPQWPLVRGFAGRERWDRLEPSDLHDLRETLATLPSENADDNPDARDFDLRCVALQVALLEGKRSLPAQIEEMVDLAGRLLEKRAIPQVAGLDPGLAEEPLNAVFLPGQPAKGFQSQDFRVFARHGTGIVKGALRDTP